MSRRATHRVRWELWPQTAFVPEPRKGGGRYRQPIKRWRDFPDQATAQAFVAELHARHGGAAEGCLVSIETLEPCDPPVQLTLSDVLWPVAVGRLTR